MCVGISRCTAHIHWINGNNFKIHSFFTENWLWAIKLYWRLVSFVWRCDHSKCAPERVWGNTQTKRNEKRNKAATRQNVGKTDDTSNIRMLLVCGENGKRQKCTASCVSACRWSRSVFCFSQFYCLHSLWDRYRRCTDDKLSNWWKTMNWILSTDRNNRIKRGFLVEATKPEMTR